MRYRLSRDETNAKVLGNRATDSRPPRRGITSISIKVGRRIIPGWPMIRCSCRLSMCVASGLKALLSHVEGSLNLIQWLSTPGFDGERQVRTQALDGPRHLLLKTQSLRTPAGERYKIIAITDVTKLTQALHESEQHARQWEALNAGVVVCDALEPDLPITYVNQAFERMTGYTRDETVGRNCRFLQGDDQNQQGIIAIKTAIKTGTNGYAVLRNYRKNGSMFLNELFISPVHSSDGELTHFVGIQHLRLTDLKNENFV